MASYMPIKARHLKCQINGNLNSPLGHFKRLIFGIQKPIWAIFVSYFVFKGTIPLALKDFLGI